MEQKPAHPNYIFEVSWEVCNKVGGIHTVITTKTLTLVKEWDDHLIMIGPDTWKGPGENPEFTEDKNLFASWRNHAAERGLKIKIGRWKITGNPIAILIDFTPFFISKDEIFSELWLHYKVDSLTGGWDYIEPALFGYAAGKVIESFYHHYLTFSDKIIAQFHEWITGVGLLYLNENVPQIGTVFTTHATVVGRSIAGNGLPLYSKFDTYNAEQEARNFNVTAKHSLEKKAALNADCFTTVSNITAKECEQFLEKKPDIITPNGFDDFIVPDEIFFKEKRTLARKKLFEVAEAMFNYDLPDDTLFIIKSGRYEFRNKGIDIFIDALGELNKNSDLKKKIVAFIFIPAHNNGPRKDIIDIIENSTKNLFKTENLITHNLQGAESDLIVNRIQQNKLTNNESQHVKVVFAPVYLNGNDGIFNLSYYEMLVGFDLSVFPSYYEPWGYTPLESLAFHIPTITTNLTGFGMIVNTASTNISTGIEVVNRNDTNDSEATKNITSIIKEFSEKSGVEIKKSREAAFQLSKKALWKNYIDHYKEAYSLALEKANSREHRFMHQATVKTWDVNTDIQLPKITEPVWRKIFVQSQLPANLKSLDKLARNLWYTWNSEATELFEMMDRDLWKKSNFNPILLLDTLPYSQLKRLEKNNEFVSKLNSVNEHFEAYLNRPFNNSIKIAYFCMEYGLCPELKIYSGGLGILAGDFLKQASDSNINMVGVGLLYRNGYFKQEISQQGEQLEIEEEHKFTNLPMSPVYDKDENWLKIGIAFPGRTVYAKIWKVDVGVISLYLLDTDIPENKAEDQTITNNLYGGDRENRLKQELLLGIGGVRLLKILNINPDIFHYNEGHAAFAGLERLLILVQDENISFDEAIEVVRASSLFTTHTPVPAGHDRFNEDLLRIYLAYHANLLNISWKKMMGLGKVNEDDINEKFSMSFLAARISGKINGVSSMHEKVSRRIFGPLWNGYSTEELNLGHVTNGVHLLSWLATEWQALYLNTFGEKFFDLNSEVNNWKKINEIADKTIWEIHLKLKNKLITELKKYIDDEKRKKKTNNLFLPDNDFINEKTLIIGFAKRIVTYKQPTLIFQDLTRLNNIIKNSKVNILFVFAGKAHPNDTEGQEIIQNIINISKQENFKNHILFLQNYDMAISNYLVKGVDVWLNTPEIEMEASGTSGIKAMINGVINFSALDGWWAEAYKPDYGWTYTENTTKNNLNRQKEIEAEALYNKLEHEIIPLYLTFDANNLPAGWIKKIKAALSNLAAKFSTNRMLNDYIENYYLNLKSQNNLLIENNYDKAKKLAAWKLKIIREWNKIHLNSMEAYDSENKAFPVGSELCPNINLDLNNLSSSEIGVEIIFIEKRKDDKEFEKIVYKTELFPTENKNIYASYVCKIPITHTGVYEYSFRVYPKSELLTNRLDFPILKWL